ncbi:MAG: hypothetical protein U1E05_21310 [Patescibacteria group bacterium]|nr:hypothetical protein [Patescibacteria group bacterium]
MRNTIICACLLAALSTGTARAQRPDRPGSVQGARTGSTISVGELQPTPEMWFYEQYQQQSEDPSVAVREKAEFRASQRLNRMAAMRWFGMSNSRPPASSDPFHGDYSPKWTSNNSRYPNRWMGQATPLVVVQSEESRTR